MRYLQTYHILKNKSYNQSCPLAVICAAHPDDLSTAFVSHNAARVHAVQWVEEFKRET